MDVVEIGDGSHGLPPSRLKRVLGVIDLDKRVVFHDFWAVSAVVRFLILKSFMVICILFLVLRLGGWTQAVGSGRVNDFDC